MELAKRAKYEGLPVFLETCPHYLFLDENAIVEYGSFAKFQPALRKRETVDKLWDYINDGTVDYIGSDHGPFTLAEKLRGGGNIHDAFAGTPGIDLRLPLMLDAAYKGKVSLERCVELLSVNPAKCFYLYPQKGSVSPGLGSALPPAQDDRPRARGDGRGRRRPFGARLGRARQTAYEALTGIRF